MRFLGGLVTLLALAAGVMIYIYVDFLEQSKTHYSVLGVSEAATLAQIRTAYRKMSLKHHPDKRQHGGNEFEPSVGSNEPFYEIVEAYEVLSDDERRRHYDDELIARRHRQADMRNQFHAGRGGSQQFDWNWHLRHLLPMAHPTCLLYTSPSPRDRG